MVTREPGRLAERFLTAQLLPAFVALPVDAIAQHFPTMMADAALQALTEALGDASQSILMAAIILCRVVASKRAASLRARLVHSARRLT